MTSMSSSKKVGIARALFDRNPSLSLAVLLDKEIMKFVPMTNLWRLL